MTAPSRLYGLLAQFPSPERLVEATHAAHEAGYRRFDAYSPYPVPDLFPTAARGWGHYLLRGIAFLAVVGGAGAAYLLQYWTSVVDYPINVGGRPLHSWPMFLPSAILLAILGGSVAAAGGLLMLSGLPRLHHPVFNSPHFARTTEDSFYLCIEASDTRFDPERTRAFLASLAPERLEEVPW
ncbi:DUF3341 domain-containing protein [Azospirillum sp. SYSU D00513]|uniref:DUF3341 domain-containing protein n=1 Tax=Azospirillum sp. SYSU D00513 TaxID=2812561 RepID=UPI001A966423|nr:DUF3341 domain-containing protein [Azospirillum sp. SYSU D00513]